MNFEKTPESQLNYTVNWSAWLTNGETIAESEWTVEDGLTLVSDSKTTVAATAFIGGGASGRKYKAINTITTNGTPALIESAVIFITVRSL